jgi:hypothetical protein
MFPELRLEKKGRKSIAFQINALASSYSIPLQGELAAYLPKGRPATLNAAVG